jgi:hypothetical protein
MGFEIQLSDPTDRLTKRIVDLEERLDGSLVIKRKGKSHFYDVFWEGKDTHSKWTGCNSTRVRILLERFFKGETCTSTPKSGFPKDPKTSRGPYTRR